MRKISGVLGLLLTMLGCNVPAQVADGTLLLKIAEDPSGTFYIDKKSTDRKPGVNQYMNVLHDYSAAMQRGIMGRSEILTYRFMCESGRWQVVGRNQFGAPMGKGGSVGFSNAIEASNPTAAGTPQDVLFRIACKR